MEAAYIFLAGFLAGGLIVRWLLIAADARHLKSRAMDPQYRPACRAVIRYLQVHGTINLSQAEYLLSSDTKVTARYLAQMAEDRRLRFHGHSEAGGFYTLA